MATESPLIVMGAQCVSTADLRNSTFSGTTRMGPSGSGQFLAVRLSTVVDRVFYVTTSNGLAAIGILQDKPAVADPGSIAILGVSKAVGGSSSIVAGMDLMCDSSGCLIAYSSGAGVARMAKALEACTAIGNVFSALIYGANGPGSLA